MTDENGFAELVVHPPPINYLIVFLLPSLFNESSMQRASRTFSKFIFWLENIVHISMLLIYELMLVPIIYFKMIFNILAATDFPWFLIYIIGWIGYGPFYLLFCAFQDLSNFIRILYDSKEDMDEAKIREAEDEMQDRIVIYNEVLDTLRAIMNIFRHHRNDLLPKNGKRDKAREAWYGLPKADKAYEDFGTEKLRRSEKHEFFKSITD
jgi:hypothetical protein